MKTTASTRGKGRARAKRRFAVKDSGKRANFASGMMRDTSDGKLDYERVFDGPLIDRLAALLTTAAEKKYPDTEPGRPNWTLGSGSAELIRARKSAVRHFRQWLRGDQDEDHFAGVVFNMNLVEYIHAPALDQKDRRKGARRERRR